MTIRGGSVFELMTRRALLIAIVLMAPVVASAQQEIAVDIDRSKAGATVRVAVPFPALGPGLTVEDVHRPFFTPLTGDLAFSEIFTIVPLPPGVPPSAEVASRAGAQAYLRLTVRRDGEDFVVEAQLIDIATSSLHMGRRYRTTSAGLTRLAHTIANDLVLFFNGRPGMFLSQIVFVSDRDGRRALYIMDYDGSNQRKISFYGGIPLTPDWSPDSERLAYTEIRGNRSDLYIINRRGGGRIRLDTGVGLNSSPAFSPDGSKLAFVGSVAGNPDIYTIGSYGRDVHRLTSEPSIESTPSWSPTGRQIAFTSGRSGTPQIYVMDAEGTNVRRISFDGNWNDDAVWHPSGELLAYTSRVNGVFQIRLMNLTTGETKVLAGLGSNEQPSWSPDGRWIVFMSNRSGKWQIYRMGIDGRDLMQLTREGSNQSPTWSR